MKRIILYFAIILCINASLQKLSPLVKEDIQKTNKEADIIVVLKDQVDFNSLNLENLDHSTRGKLVVSTVSNKKVFKHKNS